MLPEAYDEEIRSARAKKRNDAINLFGFDKMAGYLNGLPPPLGNCRLHEFFVKSLRSASIACATSGATVTTSPVYAGGGSITVMVCSGVPSSLHSAMPAHSASRAGGESSYATMIF